MNYFDIIDQQADFIVVNKHANINFHDEGDIGQGLFSQVKKQINISELYPVHRLDKMTSGLILFATNKTAANVFQTLFSQHAIEKYYLAISHKKPIKKQGLVKGDMEKSRRSMWKLLRTQNNPAITQFFSSSLGNGLRAFILKPHSGKTHQIRVALASIGSPILGDKLYAKNIIDKQNTPLDRGYLHAFMLNFTINQQHFSYSLAPDFGQHFTSPEFKQWLVGISPVHKLSWPKIN